jgi:F0F1-type ATP synthase membrane subunit b/b'
LETKEENTAPIITEAIQPQKVEAETQSVREIEETMKEIEHKLNDFLKVLNEETMQLSEFLMVEKTLTHELCRFLRQSLKRLNISFSIPPKAIPSLEKARQIILNEEGHLIVVQEKGRITSKLLEDYTPDIILMVLWNIIPELSKAMGTYRKRISFRVNFFEKLKKELKNIFKAFASSEGKLQENSDDSLSEDAVKKALQSNGKA